MAENGNHAAVIVRLAILETKLDGVNTRLDIANGRTAKLEGRVETLTAIDVDTINQVKGLTESSKARTVQIASWREFFLNNLGTIFTGIVMAYLLYRFGWR